MMNPRHSKLQRARAVATVCSLGASLACQPDTPPSRAERIDVQDSIRVRAERAFELRPDTFGARADSQRILRAGPVGGRAPWVVVVSDFQCQECRRFALEVVAPLRREIVQTGVANLAFVNAPQEAHFNARFAALAALCAAADGRFWEMHDSLFASLPRWDRLPDPRPFLDSLAIAAGVRADRQRDCLERNRLLRLLYGDLRRSEAIGGDALPAVFVADRRLSSAERTLDGVRQALARATR